jgi:hypothetical protein
MVLRCTRSRLESTTRTLNVDQCFRITPSTPFVLIILPFLPNSLAQGVFVTSTETHSVQVSSGRKGVSHHLHQPTLHLPCDSLVSQPLPNDFSVFPFSVEEVAPPCIREWFRVWIHSQLLHDFSSPVLWVSDRPVRKISTLDITRSTPLDSALHPCNHLVRPSFHLEVHSYGLYLNLTQDRSCPLLNSHTQTSNNHP